MRGGTRRLGLTTLILVGAIIVLGAVAVTSLMFGSKITPLGDLLDAWRGTGDPYLRSVIDLRMERTVLGNVTGAALAVSGLLLQSATGNPLADPGLLGITGGASAAMVAGSAFFGLSLGSHAAVWVALAGAGIAAVAVYVLGSGGDLVRLVLAGAVIAAVLTAFIQAVTISRVDVFDDFRFWVVGSLSAGGGDATRLVAPFLIAGLVIAVAVAPGLNAVALGRESATALGTHTTRTIALSLLAATLLAAGATAAVGPIAFVGLAVPHVARALVGADVRVQLWLCLVLGPVMLVGADILARIVLRPQEIMVGVVTAFVGAPALLLAVRRLRDER